MVYNAKVKIYGIDKSINVSSNIDLSTSETIHSRNENEVAGISKYLLAETETDELGNYAVALNSLYDGGTLDIDICCTNAPTELASSTHTYKNSTEKQFLITTVQPFWQISKDQASLVYQCNYEIEGKAWASLLKVFKLHVICGRLFEATDNQAIASASIFAYDLDLLQDDYLGMAHTDENGCYKIIYRDDDYQKTIFENMSSEWRNCPDIYFRIESQAGKLLLKEDRKCGIAKNRKNANTCLVVDFKL